MLSSKSASPTPGQGSCPRFGVTGCTTGTAQVAALISIIAGFDAAVLVRSGHGLVFPQEFVRQRHPRCDRLSGSARRLMGQGEAKSWPFAGARLGQFHADRHDIRVVVLLVAN